MSISYKLQTISYKEFTFQLPPHIYDEWENAYGCTQDNFIDMEDNTNTKLKCEIKFDRNLKHGKIRQHSPTGKIYITLTGPTTVFNRKSSNIFYQKKDILVDLVQEMVKQGERMYKNQVCQSRFEEKTHYLFPTDS